MLIKIKTQKFWNSWIEKKIKRKNWFADEEIKQIKEAMEQLTKKKLNSVYITFSINKEAVLAILSIDSTNINGNFVRAFFE